MQETSQFRLDVQRTQALHAAIDAQPDDLTKSVVRSRLLVAAAKVQVAIEVARRTLHEADSHRVEFADLDERVRRIRSELEVLETTYRRVVSDLE